MSRVSLICTAHSEIGRANAIELVSILEQIRPAVAFLEISPEHLNTYLSRTSRGLEPAAIARYRTAHNLTLVAVDIPPPSQDLAQGFNQLLEAVERASPEYCRLNVEYDQYVGEYGFAFLNGPLSSKFSAAIEEVMKKVIDEIGDPQLINLYASWIGIHHSREDAILKRVADFADRHPFETGVLFVGASHRQAIIDKTRSLWRTGLMLSPLDLDVLQQG